MTDNETIHLALASERNYFCGMFVTATSVAHFANSGTKLHFVILDGGLDDNQFDELKQAVRREHAQSDFTRIDVNEVKQPAFPKWHGNTVAYARLFLSECLPESVHHIVYCDVHFLWMADVSELWALRNDDNPVISTRDINQVVKDGECRWCARHGLNVDKNTYFCTGLLLLNLDILRREKIADKAIALILHHPDIGSPDQTALNVIVSGRAKLVDQKWQRFSRDSPVETLTAPMVLHFAGDVPWKISKRSHMLTDVQLLWFRFDASIRNITLWQSLRLHYSVLEIVLNRLAFKLIICSPLRHLFDYAMRKAGRWGFYERLPAKQRRNLMQLLTFQSPVQE